MSIIRTKKGPLDAVATGNHVVVYAPSPEIKSSFEVVHSTEISLASSTSTTSSGSFVFFNTHCNLILLFDGSVINVDDHQNQKRVATVDFISQNKDDILALTLSKNDLVAFVVLKNQQDKIFVVSVSTGKVVSSVQVSGAASTTSTNEKALLPSLNVSSNNKLLFYANPSSSMNVVYTFENGTALTNPRLTNPRNIDAANSIGGVFSYDSKSLFVVCNFNQVMRFDVSSESSSSAAAGEITFDIATGASWAISVDLKYEMLCVLFNSGEIFSVDVEKWKVVANSPSSTFSQIAFHPHSGHLLACLSKAEGNVAFWNSHMGDVLKTLSVATDNVVSKLAFSPDGLYLAVSSSSLLASTNILTVYSFVLGVPLPKNSSLTCDHNVSRMSFSEHCGTLDIVEDVSAQLHTMHMEGFIAAAHVERIKALTDHANQLVAENKIDEAIEKYSVTINLEPFNPELLLLRSRAELLSSLCSSSVFFAKRDIERALSLNSSTTSFAPLLAQLGTCNAIEGYEKALDVVEDGKKKQQLQEEFAELKKKLIELGGKF